jgi:hypothetical protein
MPEFRCKTACEESQDAHQPADAYHVSLVFLVLDREGCDERVSEIGNSLRSTLGKTWQRGYGIPLLTLLLLGYTDCF